MACLDANFLQLILNEQYMVLANDPSPDQSHTVHVSNRVIKFLSFHGSGYKTFGENLILLLNRESNISLLLQNVEILNRQFFYRRNIPSTPYP